MKSVSILGSTGSVGRATIDLILSRPDQFSVQALTAHRNAALLAGQAIKLKAKRAVVADQSAYDELKKLLSGTGIETAAGSEAVIEAASLPADWIMAAIVGMAGLKPVMAAVKQGSCVAIANKEPLVAAGPLVLAAAKKSGAAILPVDSEHNAVFQVFDRERPGGIERITLTASGGPFLNWSTEQTAKATPEQAIAHPNWTMGRKISVDSATMMNKALEVIEAHYLFGLPPEKIGVVIHPQSIVHALVTYKDGSVLAQMGAPDMRTPIAHTLAWPERMATTGRTLDLAQAMTLDFRPLDPAQFPAVGLAYDCLKAGPGACLAFNAANEEAVAAFLEKRLGFSQIIEVVSGALDRTNTAPDMDSVLALDKEVRQRAKSLILAAERRAA